MDWGLFAFGVSAILVAIWVWMLTQRRWTWPGLITSAGCLFAACLNTAAPFRGFIDPNYVGYSFGLLHASKGISVTLLSGTVFVASLVAALIAISRSSGKGLWFVGATSAALLVIVGLPTIRDALADPSANAIQFGEYLTIPGLLATVILVLLLCLPFAIGAVWASSAAARTSRS